jgi:hypothetical protein
LLALLPIGGLISCASARSQALAGAGDRLISDDATSIATIWARDPLANSIEFADGREGCIFQDRQVKNSKSDLDFDNYHAGEFTVGIQGSVVGSIVDLGSPADLQAKYRYRETVGGGQGFASIRPEGGEFVILGPDGKTSKQPLGEAKALYDGLKPGAHALVQMGHIYLVRLQDGPKSKDRITKFLVLAHIPGESVTIRWVRLEG